MFRPQPRTHVSPVRLLFSCALMVALSLLLLALGGSSQPHEFIGWLVD